MLGSRFTSDVSEKLRKCAGEGLTMTRSCSYKCVRAAGTLTDWSSATKPPGTLGLRTCAVVSGLILRLTVDQVTALGRLFERRVPTLTLKSINLIATRTQRVGTTRENPIETSAPCCRRLESAALVSMEGFSLFTYPFSPQGTGPHPGSLC